MEYRTQKESSTKFPVDLEVGVIIDQSHEMYSCISRVNQTQPVFKCRLRTASYIARSMRTLVDRRPEASFGRYALFGYSREAVQLYSPSQDVGELGEIRMTCSGSRHSSQIVRLAVPRAHSRFDRRMEIRTSLALLAGTIQMSSNEILHAGTMGKNASVAPDD